MNKKTIALIILDGWGHSEEHKHNPIQNVDTPTFDYLFKHYPHTLLEASGEAVGLPKGQMGNSEVGHLHIGAGRKVPQDLMRINIAIDDGSFFKNDVLIDALNQVKKNNKKLHIMGLTSPGGVHSQLTHLLAMIKMAQDAGLKNHYFHAFLDGRDTPPKSALPSLEKIEAMYATLGSGKLASIIGRYYAMDRDKRWDRTQKAYDLLTQGKALVMADNAKNALKIAYDEGLSDEFVKPTLIDSNGIIENGDVVIFMNFRADRARQLCYALTDPDFSGFKRAIFPHIKELISLTLYADNLNARPAFPPIHLHNTLGEFLSEQGKTQLRIAETEKYAHVTYFINGGRERIFANEDRILVPSPKIATYDLQPEMSAIELTDKLTAAIESGKYDVIICNYANPDMIGHTGKEDAANKAVSVMDHCIKRVIDSLKKVNGEAFITADHGNIECMYDEKHHQPHTAHTNNLVPFIYVGREAKFINIKPGALDDIAPTLLSLLNLNPPPEMTGKNLLREIK